MKPYIKAVMLNNIKIDMESNVDKYIDSVNGILKARELISEVNDVSETGNKISYIIISEELGILFTRVFIRTVKGHLVPDKENTSTYHQDDLLDGVMNYVNRQKNTDFIFILNDQMKAINDELFVRLKETKIKIRTTEKLILYPRSISFKEFEINGSKAVVPVENNYVTVKISPQK